MITKVPFEYDLIKEFGDKGFLNKPLDRLWEYIGETISPLPQYLYTCSQCMKLDFPEDKLVLEKYPTFDEFYREFKKSRVILKPVAMNDCMVIGENKVRCGYTYWFVGQCQKCETIYWMKRKRI